MECFPLRLSSLTHFLCARCLNVPAVGTSQASPPQVLQRLLKSDGGRRTWVSGRHFRKANNQETTWCLPFHTKQLPLLTALHLTAGFWLELQEVCCSRCLTAISVLWPGVLSKSEDHSGWAVAWNVGVSNMGWGTHDTDLGGHVFWILLHPTRRQTAQHPNLCLPFPSLPEGLLGYVQTGQWPRTQLW